MLGATMMQEIADAGITLRGMSAAANGGRFVCYLALDSESDAAKAEKMLTKMEMAVVHH